MVQVDGRAFAAQTGVTDSQRRVKLVSSVIKGLQYIKLSALEPVAAKLLSQARAFEIGERTHLQAQARVVCLLACVSSP